MWDTGSWYLRSGYLVGQHYEVSTCPDIILDVCKDAKPQTNTGPGGRIGRARTLHAGDREFGPSGVKLSNLYLSLPSQVLGTIRIGPGLVRSVSG